MPGSVSRRGALKILGIVPVAAALGAPQTALRRGRRSRRVDAQAPAAPKFFTAHEWATVRMLVDYIIPRDERSGSATDAKVPEYMDFLLAEKDANVNNADRDARRPGLARHRVPQALREDVHRVDRRAAARRCSTTSRIRRRRSRR